MIIPVRPVLGVTLFAAFISMAFAQADVSSSAFNPAISLILDGRFAEFEDDPSDYTMPGFQLGGEAGIGKEGLALGHNELAISANIDDQYFGKFTVAIADHEGATEVELEEAYVETLALGSGMTVRAGRFYSGLGYINDQHAHAWDFTDAPLIYRGLFGDQLRDDGVQIRWVAPTDIYLQLGAEVLRGDKFPAGGGANEGRGAQTLFAKAGGDLGASHSWQFGLARWQAQVDERAAGAHDHGGGASEVPTFDGDSAVNAIDFVWKWAPDGNPAQRNLKIQAEYLVRDEDGDVVLVGSDPLESTRYDGKQSGWYMQAVYQFMPRWRVGLRYDRAEADNEGSEPDVLDEAGLNDLNHTSQRTSVMVDFSNSEFSRWRVQYNHDESGIDTDRQLYVQYVMSLGAHGAHAF